MSGKLKSLGWAAGVGIEASVAPHWTARLEYLFTDYGNSNVLFANAGQRFTSDLSLQELRAGLNYQFGNDPAAAIASTPAPAATDRVNFHGQATFTEQVYPAIRSPFEGPNSLPGSGQGRETTDVTLYAGVGLWRGAELWINPEIDQGFGLGDVHGAAGFPSAEAFKLGHSYPYARVQRAFLRQTIDIGGDAQKVDADINQFAGSQTANRLTLTVGRFAITDIFDTNAYANNPKNDFLNWSVVNAGTFDYAGDAWGITYGAAAEWYQGNWTVRGGIFDLSKTPAGGISPEGGQLDSSFGQFQLVGEIERRYQLWDQPGLVKITAFNHLGTQKVGAVVIGSDPSYLALRAQILALTASHRIPAIYELRQYVAAGGLMSYGTDLTDALRLAGIYVGRILNGEKPADLPVVQETKFQLVINNKTAKSLGINISGNVLSLADEVIE